MSFSGTGANVAEKETAVVEITIEAEFTRAEFVETIAEITETPRLIGEAFLAASIDVCLVCSDTMIKLESTWEEL